MASLTTHRQTIFNKHRDVSRPINQDESRRLKPGSKLMLSWVRVWSGWWRESKAVSSSWVRIRSRTRWHKWVYFGASRHPGMPVVWAGSCTYSRSVNGLRLHQRSGYRKPDTAPEIVYHALLIQLLKQYIIGYWYRSWSSISFIIRFIRF